MPCCNTTCEKCDLITNVVVKPKTCEGLFLFEPDLYTCPGVTAGPNTEVCALDVNILTNCKGDLKLTLLDDNGCNLDCLVLRCSQYDVSQINAGFVGVSPVRDLFNAYVAQGYTEIIKINANNLNLVGEYVAFEEAAYYYRQVCQSYQNLWCGAERNGIVCLILENVKKATQLLAADEDGAVSAQQIFSLGQDLLKARVVALKQLCECGKVCNDQFFPIHTTPCQALKGCCPQRH